MRTAVVGLIAFVVAFVLALILPSFLPLIVAYPASVLIGLALGLVAREVTA